ncbi:cupin domain-containing protein [Segetibacter aerophilus]|uniref:Cupin n=1 Tax=Segetibacter aerophilus TaxID=670293 RepID=A0A512B8H6_9BACT|nr:cupin domain-containing protein [Segetibacter aerophilus]GEO08258.1 cupin [Segetibacter aerophilus]
MKILMITAIASMALLTISCMENKSENKSTEFQAIFPKGEKGPAEHFTGAAFNTPLVADDSIYNTVIGNVYFEPGARSNWHTHPSGQILIITDGVGYYQEKGQLRRTMKKGDLIKCPPNVLHWHGASPDTGVQQMYILPKTEKGIVTWLQKVRDEEYNSSN